jgi:hypothetical protein
LRLKGRLLFTPGVMVTNVPYQLASSEIAARRPERLAPGSVRRPDTYGIMPDGSPRESASAPRSQTRGGGTSG